MGKYTKEDLKEMQSWSLEQKVENSMARIFEYYTKYAGKCYVSISGKDSTAVAYMCAKCCEILGYKLVIWYSDTGLEFPEVKKHVREYAKWLDEKFGCEVELIEDYPKDKNGKRITFRDVIEKYGYPLISKEVSQKIYEARKTPGGACDKRFDPNGEYAHKYGGRFFMGRWTWLKDRTDIPISHMCCIKMKKEPAKRFEHKTGLHPIVGTTAEESALRKSQWYKSGCNAFDAKRPMSKPISVWKDSDVWEYIKQNDIPYPSVYGDIVCDCGKYSCTGEKRTGCMWCCYGVHLEKSPNKFQRMKVTHPKIYEYCMRPWDKGGLGLKTVLEAINVKVD